MIISSVSNLLQKEKGNFLFTELYFQQQGRKEMPGEVSRNASIKMQLTGGYSERNLGPALVFCSTFWLFHSINLLSVIAESNISIFCINRYGRKQGICWRII